MAHRAMWAAWANSRCDLSPLRGHVCRIQTPHKIHRCEECGAPATDEHGDPLPETDQPALSEPIKVTPPVVDLVSRLRESVAAARERRLAETSSYDAGMADGTAGRDPDTDRLALGANRLNDYERGYIDAGPTVGEAAIQHRPGGPGPFYPGCPACNPTHYQHHTEAETP